MNTGTILRNLNLLEYTDNNINKQNLLAINFILKFYKLPLLNDECLITEDVESLLHNLLPQHGLIGRSIELKNDWYKYSMGAIIGKMHTGETIVFLPKLITGYSYLNCKTMDISKVTKKNMYLFKSNAFYFNKSLPKRSLNIFDLFKYILYSIPLSKYILLFLSYLIITLLGLVLPKINNYIFNNVIYESSHKSLLIVSYILFGVTIITSLFTIINRTIIYNIRTTISSTLQNSLMDRILSLPISFFKEYSSGNITKRFQNFISVISQMIDTMLITILTVLFSLIYLIQILNMIPELATPALILTLSIIILIVFFIITQISVYTKLNRNDVKVSSSFFSLISGIQKIKLDQAEKSSFNYWAKKYKNSAKLLYNPPFILKIQPNISLIYNYVITIIMYCIAVNSNISISSFITFSVAFGIITSALSSLSDVSIVFAQFYSTVNLLNPILSTIPDNTNSKTPIKITGNVEIKNVSFKYNEQSKNILNNFSLKISSGQYIAITGPTGCGKSTLLRLLLGFNIAQCGTITYDNVNIVDINLKNLRKQIGTVLQDGKLFTGSIFENITFFNNDFNMDDAWRAAEIAEIADDIRNMPMGMFTMISEGDGSISGGQKQRILIARAIISQPKILILDEATSALDNITQDNLINSLEKLDCTKIVVAHRLSTLQHCDKIIMIDNGEVLDEGTYEYLIKNSTTFYNFVSKQQLDNNNIIN